MDEIKVSILVPAYNVEAYAEECLRSLLAQTLREIEIVWVDDGSTDRTHEVATRFAASDARLRLFRLPAHLGVSAARNACLKEARGRYVTFVDCDDTISPEAVEHLWRKAVASDADIVTGSVLYCYAAGTRTRVGDKQAVFGTEETVWDGQTCFRLWQECGCYVPMVCGNLYRTAFIREHGLHFEGNYHEDEYFTPYALYYARRVAELKEDFYFYRQRDNSIMHNPDNRKARAEALYHVGQELKQFAAAQISPRDIMLMETYKSYGDYLCLRSQNIYENALKSSNCKCMLSISEDCIAARYGVGTYIKYLSHCFEPSQWDVILITIYSSQGKDVEFSFIDGKACYKFPIFESQLSRLASYGENYIKSIFYYMATRIPLNKRPFCHFHFAHHRALAALFKKRMHAHILFTLHYMDWCLDLAGDRKWLESILSHPICEKDLAIKKRFEQERDFMLNECDRVIAIAHHSYIVLHELYNIPLNKLSCIPNGLPDTYQYRSEFECQSLRTKYGFCPKDKIFIFSGRLDPIKGVVELLQAFSKVQKMYIHAKLIIAGSGNFQKCLESVSPYWKLVTFTGFISHEQLSELYAIADWGVVPSVHEEFGYVAAEMMLHKLPVIVNDTTGLGEMTEHGKYSITFKYSQDRGDIEPLTNALLAALQEEKDCVLQKQEEARQWILNQYLLPVFEEKIKSLYNEMESAD